MLRNETYQLHKVFLDGIVINNTIFYTLQKNLTIALEVLFYFSIFGDDSFFAVYPQVHLGLIPNFELQLGAGFVARKENFVPQIVNKLIFAPRS